MVEKVEGRRKETKGKSGRKEEMGEVGKGTELKENRCKQATRRGYMEDEGEGKGKKRKEEKGDNGTGSGAPDDCPKLTMYPRSFKTSSDP